MAAARLLLLLVAVAVSFCSVMQRCHAFQFKVGGSQGSWILPTDPNASIYNHWAQNTRFQIGDSLLFVYSADHDSVLRVTKEDYANCTTDKPLDKFTDGHTVYHLNQSGPHYFISGEAEHCHKNQKLIVVVLADRSNNHASSPPSPSPSSSSSPPSPAPSAEDSPSPPPEEANPTPAPSEESSPPKNNAVSSVAAGVVGTVAVFFASFLTI